MIKANIDGKEIELKPDQLDLGEGYALITPDNIPEGYFNEDAVQSRIKDRLANTAKNTEQRLLEDDSFKRKVLSQYNIQLDDSGRPLGLKPTVDVDEVKQNVIKEVSGEWEEKYNNLKNTLKNRNEAVIKNSIMSAVKGQWKEDWVKPFDGGDPLVVDKYKSKFTVDDKGRAVLKDESNDGIKYKGDGTPMTAEDYLLNEKVFGELFTDKRQRSTGTSAGGGQARFTPEEISKMSDAEYEKNRDAILKSASN